MYFTDQSKLFKSFLPEISTVSQTCFKHFSLLIQINNPLIKLTAMTLFYLFRFFYLFVVLMNF